MKLKNIIAPLTLALSGFLTVMPVYAEEAEVTPQFLEITDCESCWQSVFDLGDVVQAQGEVCSLLSAEIYEWQQDCLSRHNWNYCKVQPEYLDYLAKKESCKEEYSYLRDNKRARKGYCVNYCQSN